MMTTEHDEALVERVALALARAKYGQSVGLGSRETEWHVDARAVIYPPAPPKTRLQVARQVCADACVTHHEACRYISGENDGNNAMKAVLAALALPAMED